MYRRGGVALLLVVALSCRSKEQRADGAARMRARFAAGLDSIQLTLAALDSAAQRGSSGEELRRAFRMTRTAFKHQEALIASEAPSTLGVLNGPLPEDDDGPPRPLGAPA